MVQYDFAGDSSALECRNLSFIKTVYIGKWYMRLYNPPLNAQFLKDVSLTVRAGEIHGITGTSGSGKTTLLRVISGRCGGALSGQITLNDQTLDGDRFNELCAYISFRRPFLSSLTVKSVLNYYANLTVCTLDSKEKEERILSLMREFDLLSCGNERIDRLKESTRRRVIICMYLIRDPILVLIDEPTRGIEPLSGYQLMSSLSSYMKRSQRMALVALRCPRSDLYQLMTRVTVLFFGETLYSGFTKQMPVYFRQAGYPCPSNENPAVYYLSLATIDRETSERYQETQEQALKLVDMFKHHDIAQHGRQSLSESYPSSSQQPLCTFGGPNPISKLFTLTRRSFSVVFWSRASLLSRVILLPLCALIVVTFGVHFPLTSPSAPSSVAAMWFACQMLFSIAAVFTAAACYSALRLEIAREVEEGLVSGALGTLSLLVASFPPDAVALISSSSLLIWLSEVPFGWSTYANVTFLLWCCYQASFLMTVLCMGLIRNSYTATVTSIAVSMFSLTYAGSFTRAARSLAMISAWMYYGTYASISRYVSWAFNAQFVSPINVTNCNRVEHSGIDPTHPTHFCRWNNGSAYLEEIYAEDMDDANLTVDMLGCVLHVSILTAVVLIFHTSVIARRSANKSSL